MDPQEQQEVAEILEDDPAPFRALIFRLASITDEERWRAQRIFRFAKQANMELVFTKLGHLLQPNNNMQTRYLSAFVLRQELPANDWLIWNNLFPDTQTLLRSNLLDCLQQEEYPETWTKIFCDTISGLALHILPNGWPEFFPTMFARFTLLSPDWLQESTLLIFAHLLQHDVGVFDPHIETLTDVFYRCLTAEPEMPFVRIAALRAVIMFWSTSVRRNESRVLIQVILPTLRQALTGPDQGNFQDSLEMLVDLAQNNHLFFVGHLTKVADSMMSLVEDEDVRGDTRRHVLDFLFALVGIIVEGGVPRVLVGMSYNTEFYADKYGRKLFPIFLRMLVMDPQEENQYGTGIEFLDRLVVAAYGQDVIRFALESPIPTYIKSPNPLERQAAIVALHRTLERRPELFSTAQNRDGFEDLLFMILEACKDLNFQVKWAAVTTFSSLATTFGRGLEVRYHPFVLDVLRHVIHRSNDIHMRAHAEAALQTFQNNCVLPP